ncbi:DNA-binding protein [Agromyces mariniharenae]|uniref:DNA-binding protein n=1 Tax=Agromyces mariniharenae TaxID=2604423 RepID=UPI001652DF50|nr:DNA-binding protein [Agromyces mariniharenae]
MFVITADQVASRRDADRTGALVEALAERYADQLVLPADQTAGDEIQLVTRSASTALAVVLDATRTGRWSVGLGVGGIRMPLPDAARKASGSAFIAAREAVGAAKRADGRFALRAAGDPQAAADLEALVRLLLLLRERRTEPGWEVVELMRTGHQQKEAAAILDVSAAAVSARLKAAMWRAEEDARPVLERLLAELDERLAAHSAGESGTAAAE